MLFFFTLILLGLDSQFSLLETASDYFISEKIKIFGKVLTPEKTRLFLIFSTMLVGFPMYTRAGLHYLELYDEFICTIPLIVSILFEVIIFGYVIN